MFEGYSTSTQVKSNVFEFLAVLMTLKPEDAHPLVLSALDNFSYKIKERIKYEYVVNVLKVCFAVLYHLTLPLVRGRQPQVFYYDVY
jgi:hypothetical protein